MPALHPADPKRGWAWLTTDVETVDYIKFSFRMQGIWQLGVAKLVLAAAAGLRQGSRRAAPWTLPVLATPILSSLIALMLTWRDVR